MITTKFNYVHENYGEVNSQPSATVPGDAMSLRDMLDRFARGLALPEPRNAPYYNSEETLPNLASMDLVERAEYLENQKLRVDLLTQQYNDEQKQTAPVPDPSPTPKPNSLQTE